MGHPRFFDFHCDTITRERGATPAASDFFLRPGGEVSLVDNGFHIDLARLPKEWDWAQVFAVFVPDEFRGQAAVDYFVRCAGRTSSARSGPRRSWRTPFPGGFGGPSWPWRGEPPWGAAFPCWTACGKPGCG